MKMQRGLIQNWRVRHYADGDTIQGEFWGHHPNLKGGGHPMETSLIVFRTGNWVETMNSIYILGTPFENYRDTDT